MNNRKQTERSSVKPPASPLRKTYMVRLVGRCAVFLLSILLYFQCPKELAILNGWNFFKKLSILHVLWIIWLFDMIFQLIPAHKSLSLGSQKLFRQRFRPIREAINHERLKDYIIFTTKGAYKVFILWTALMLVIAALYFKGVIHKSHLFLIVVFFYVCDLICVLIWCPFRLIMKNRCCTTCRIFNWDHLMMFSPMILSGGFYGLSLLGLSLVVFCVWELSVLLHPERFWEFSNEALKCSSCTDKLCTQYCQKLR